ncbi:MAG: hypothetical protein HXX12_11855 [Geothrix sp.]|uniref:hypothetical protein n=1 Tax=Geothrix sp. TaxID=1962974 RepID=UPI00185DA59F|nr:hypothetical protein [Geothrix sp.]NWJ41649.1 hypothetical protein [Geothrix sp.]WIL20368.1 MAG: hypothetical protein QOZ81_002933 [Geothrix sp.]
MGTDQANQVLEVDVPAPVDFRGRTILVISPRFFGYELRIVEHLRSRGARVDYLNERLGDSAVVKVMLRLATALMKRFSRRYFRRSIERLAGKSYDDVLIISPESCDSEVVQWLRGAFPGARFILYMWDSFENKFPRGVEPYLQLFDKCLTFDERDAATYAIEFRPLFFCDEGPVEGGQPDFAFSFVGTIHSDRYRILRTMVACADAAKLPYFIYPYLPTRLHYWLFRVIKREFKGRRLSDFMFRGMPYQDVLEVLRSSFAIVDVEHPGQQGLTMRTLEVLGAGKKLITTNVNIKKYSFYNSNEIFILDRLNPEVPTTFFREPRGMPSKEFNGAYGLTGWANSIFQ